MGFIERILQQRSEEAKYAARTVQAEQERERARRRMLEEENAINLQLRHKAQEFFF